MSPEQQLQVSHAPEPVSSQTTITLPDNQEVQARKDVKKRISEAFLDTYMKECEWLADHGLFDGEGIYFAHGADSIPLMYAYQHGHMTGFTDAPWDTKFMIKTLNSVGANPQEVFGRYLDPDAYNPYLERWEHFTHASGDIRDKSSIEAVLADKRFDYLIFKGVRPWAFPKDPDGFMEFVRYVLEHHTKVGSTIFLSRSHTRHMSADYEAESLLSNDGYDNLTVRSEYSDRAIDMVRDAYREAEAGGVYIFVSLSKLIEGHKDARGDFGLCLDAAGNFEFFRRLK